MTEDYRAVLLEGPDLDVGPAVTVLDHREAQRAEIARVRDSPFPAPVATRWAYYPWRHTMVGLLDREPYRRLRLDRNRNKITAREQARLDGLTVAVAGLSVGHAIAHTLALEGLCGRLRLADFDDIEVSNLNRIPAGLFDVGLNKAVVVARRIAELDPYVDTEVFAEGVTGSGIDRFLDGVDVLVEVADSLDIKVLLRERARQRGIPVLMATSDRGLMDVERFDLEPDRPIFHGLVEGVSALELAGLDTREKARYVLQIVGADLASPRAAASMVEVGRTLSTWPQLAGDVVLGAATVAAAVRRIGLGQPLDSGRTRIDLDDALDGLASTAPRLPPVPSPREETAPVADDLLEAVRRAPSGGNAQPWFVHYTATELTLSLDSSRTTAMDVAFRGSYVALGAALFNARVIAAREGRLGPTEVLTPTMAPGQVATLRFSPGTDHRLVTAEVLTRGTDRALGHPRPLDEPTRAALADAAHHQGGRLHLVEAGAGLIAAGETLAAADRVRYLTETLHREMVGELVEHGEATGIEVATLGLDSTDLATLAIVRRPEVMRMLAGWGAGWALTDDTRRRVASGSALAVITVDGRTPTDYVRGGQAVEAVWVEAQARGLAVHPTSPVFLYAHDRDDLTGLSGAFADELAGLQHDFAATVGLDPDRESIALVLRLSHTTEAPRRSRRRPIETVLRDPRTA